MTKPIQPYYSLFSARASQLSVALAIAAGMLALSSSIAVAQGPATPPATIARPVCANDVWLVSIRNWCHCCKDVRLNIWHWQDGCFVPSNVEEFLATDVPDRPTCFWIHGWSVTHSDAKSTGLHVYRRLACHACRPFRLVIWSWPSERTKGFLEDARQKACLSDAGAYPLASLIDRIDPRVPVSLVGFSLGARMSTGALHLLGGGQLAGFQLEHRVHPQRTPMRAVLLAGALDNFSLAAGQRNGAALGQVDEMLVMVNCGDIALRWYPLLCGWNGPQAIGYTGTTGYLGDQYSKLAEMQVNHIVGRKHDQDPYFDSPVLLAATADIALFCHGAEERVQGSAERVQGSGFRVQKSAIRTPSKTKR